MKSVCSANGHLLQILGEVKCDLGGLFKDPANSRYCNFRVSFKALNRDLIIIPAKTMLLYVN